MVFEVNVFPRLMTRELVVFMIFDKGILCLRFLGLFKIYISKITILFLTHCTIGRSQFWLVMLFMSSIISTWNFRFQSCQFNLLHFTFYLQFVYLNLRLYSLFLLYFHFCIYLSMTECNFSFHYWGKKSILE